MRLLLTTIKNDCIHTKLSLKYLYSVVAEAPCETELMEFEPDESVWNIYRTIQHGNFDIVYFHLNMMNEDRIEQVSEWVKKAAPTKIVIMGGTQVSFETGAYMESHPQVDFIFRGEGEKVLYQFLRTIFTYEFDFENIAGLAYRENGKIYVNPMATPVRFEDLRFPYELEELEDPEVGDTVYYASFRGNPDQCGYSQYLPGRVRTLSLNRVCTELRYFLVKDVRCVRFIDKWFNFNTERAYRIWEYLINNDNGVTTFEFDVNGDYLDEETIKLLGTARKGLFRFQVDVESTNAEALAAAGRKANIYQLMYNVSKLLRYGNIEITTTLRAGLPFDSPDRFARSFNKVYELKADHFEVEVLRLRKGTRLRDHAEEYGYQYSSRPPYEVISNDFMPASDLIRIKNIAKLLKLYVSEGGFEGSIPKMLTDLRLRPYALFSGLEKYIDENRLGDRLKKKDNLYRILYGYATTLYDERSETLKLPELMDEIHRDLEHNEPADRVRKFDKKGWELHA